MMPRRQTTALVVVFSAMLLVAACGGRAARPPTTDAQRRQVAVRFTNALVEKRRSKEAMRFADASLLSLVRGFVSDSRKHRLRVVRGPIAGCPAKEMVFPVPKSPCYRFRLRGVPVPEPSYPWLSQVSS